MKNLAKEHKTAHIDSKKGFKTHLLVFVLTVQVLWLTWLLTDQTVLWPLWQNAAWAVGVLFHYLGVYVFKNKTAIPRLLASVFAFTSFSAVASCNSNNDDNSGKPQTYVLVHGAWQAPYVWDEVKANLMKNGNSVIVVELPGHGKDNTPNQNLSLNLYRDKVIEALSKVNGKVVLVGHSMGGMVVTAVAESIPTKISRLVYIGAFLPTSGQAIADIAKTDPDSQLGPTLIEAADHLTLDVKSDELTRLFINDGTAAAKQKVIDNYRAEPAIPFSNAVTLTSQNFGSVEKVYIKTLQDIVISPRLQDQMISKAGIKTIYEINSSHSPFLSQPKAVSDVLIQIGKQL
ncbi:alpha/beta fold hydrolase [Flavobacterium phragmitis]|uniref:Pimeloyl-ACP methyl ester carboxylesterase n=1 Tax=Flavobacterium phragmitis TaxID=739143 RepID=A0A1I1SZ18_9FLAO|nr:alpha/beta fold hydrolase [Flavobacterium phragmitis]SFD49183.1 Pimeloyl-ACP methyl ester carboxylesterase [Flavobacterium phragmitis]